MDTQTASNFLSTIIQGNIVILTITGAFVTFAVAFTWQYAMKAKESVLKRSQLQKEGASELESILKECYTKFKDVYRSWFSRYLNIDKFFDNLTFRHRRTRHSHVYFLMVAMFLLYPSFLLRVWVSASKRRKRKGDVYQVIRIFRKSGAHAVLLLGISQITQTVDTIWRRGKEESYVPLLSPLFFLLASVRSSRVVDEFQRRTGLSLARVSKSAVRGMVGKKVREEVVEWIALVMESGKRLVLGKKMREELIEWGALHELANMFPKELLFPIRLAIPPTARGLGYNYVTKYREEDRIAFEATKQSCLSDECLERIANIKKSYERQRRDLIKCAGQIGEANHEISRLFYFLRPEGKRRIKAIIIGLVFFSIASILCSLLTMSNIFSSSFARDFGLTVSLVLFLIVLIILVTLIGVFIRSL